MPRPPLPPFTAETAAQKARLAEDAWNTRDPARVALGYTVDSVWRNRAEFIHGREAIETFLTRKWNRELDYRLIKEVWTCRPRNWRSGQQDGASEKYLVLEAVEPWQNLIGLLGHLSREILDGQFFALIVRFVGNAMVQLIRDEQVVRFVRQRCSHVTPRNRARLGHPAR